MKTSRAVKFQRERHEIGPYRRHVACGAVIPVAHVNAAENSHTWD